MKYPFIFIILFLLLYSCKQITGGVDPLTVFTKKHIENTITETKEVIKIPIANHFDFPVGKPDAKGYYNAQKFQKNNHLGDDWNAVTGGNTDLGDPIYAIGNGKVTFAEDAGSGWGNDRDYRNCKWFLSCSSPF